NETHKPKQPKKREQPTTTYYKYANNQLYQTLIKDTKEAPPNTTKYKNELTTLSITKANDPPPLYLTQPQTIV
ncbi:MAG: hypothetical protein LBI79_05590, partial [Nitrososphaerota archaeon]|nr:hypothetical protein [Nitrososphaerota archaeon]